MAAVEDFDVVVIGSGFGGSVMALRLAQAGKRVCVLERGKEYPPGSFPRAPHEVRKNFWDPSGGLYGMYNVWFFRHMGALVSSGVGGGSLIYANVMLKKDPKWFVREDLANGGYEYWPIQREDLEPHYDEVAKVLRPQTYPHGRVYDQVEKIRAYRIAGEAVAKRVPNCSFEAVPIAVSLYNDPAKPMPGELLVDGANRYGFERRTCQLCGECVIGCNYGAKNTLDLTYLSLAERAGAIVRPRSEVRTFKPANGGYEVAYVQHEVERLDGKPFDTSTLPTTTIRCKQLVLAAGTMGSTYLLLRNAAELGNLARDQLGTRFSGNGDLMSFALMCTRRDGDEVVPWPVDPTRGPTITHALRRADAVDTGHASDGRGIYLEDAGFPSQLAWLIEGLNTFGFLSRGWRFAKQFLRKACGFDHDSDLGAELSDLLGPADLSSRTMPLLGMGRDVPDGNFTLDGKWLALDWSKRRSNAYFDGLVEVAAELARELGGSYHQNPELQLFDRAVTVHPLGGCPMGRNRAEGVVDSFGRVFGHPGFVIADGSILPGSVGPNPAFTIAAVAHRAAEELITPTSEWPA